MEDLHPAAPHVRSLGVRFGGGLEEERGPRHLGRHECGVRSEIEWRSTVRRTPRRRCIGDGPGADAGHHADGWVGECRDSKKGHLHECEEAFGLQRSHGAPLVSRRRPWDRGGVAPAAERRGHDVDAGAVTHACGPDHVALSDWRVACLGREDAGEHGSRSAGGVGATQTRRLTRHRAERRQAHAVSVGHECQRRARVERHRDHHDCLGGQVPETDDAGGDGDGFLRLHH